VRHGETTLLTRRRCSPRCGHGRRERAARRRWAHDGSSSSSVPGNSRARWRLAGRTGPQSAPARWLAGRSATQTGRRARRARGQRSGRGRFWLSWARVGEKTAPWALFGEDEQGLGEIVEAVSICKAPAIDGQQRSQPAASHAERSCTGTGRGSNALGYTVAGVEIGWDGGGSRDAGFFYARS
jgi:hypothetical protein